MKTIIEVSLRDHISAKELRESNFTIDPSIPDDWIIPRDSLIPDLSSTEVTAEGDSLHCSFNVQFTALFRSPITIEISPNRSNPCKKPGS